MGFESNLEVSNVIVSLVWLSNVGFSMSALTKIHICSLILGSLIAAALFFFVMAVMRFFAIWSAM